MEKLNKVKDFISGCGHLINDKPKLIDHETFNLRLRLLNEEIDELYDAYMNNDLTEVFDALIDIDYILKGTVIAFGLQDHYEKGFNEVHSSNMTKLIDMKKESFAMGKILKGANYKAPNLKNILEG